MIWPIKDILSKAEPFLFSSNKICPEPSNIFRVFNETRPENIRVVLCGQDPYPQVVNGKHIATGRAFGVDKGCLFQPSLEVIMDELATYYNDPFLNDISLDSTLKSWQDQGVLLLNASLTCEQFKPECAEQLYIEGTHSYYWRVNLMEKLFEWMNTELHAVIFVFIGVKAQYYAKYISEVRHFIINVPHPAADVHSGKNMFRGSKVFNNINKIINGQTGNESEIRFLEHS